MLKVYTEALPGFSHHITVQVVSKTHCSLKAAFLKVAHTVGMVGRAYNPRTGERIRGWVQLISQSVVMFSQ